MSLRPGPVPPVSAETARVAQAAFPGGNPYLRMRDELDAIVEDAQCGSLFPTRGRPAVAPWRLALVTHFQFAAGLSDRQAADVVRGRIDWKHAHSLELTDAGFDHTVLSEFRSRLLEGKAESLPLDGLLTRCRELGLLKARGRQRTDSTHVLAAVRALNRLELVRETRRHALDDLAVAAPDWLRASADPEWVKRYPRRSDEHRLPKGKEAQRELAELIGADGTALLTAVYADDAPPSCGKCRRWRRCGGCGSRTTSRPRRACGGGRMKWGSQKRHGSLARPTTRRRTWARKAAPAGSGTRSPGRRRARLTGPI